MPRETPNLVILKLLVLDRYVDVAVALRSSPEDAAELMRSFGLLTARQAELLHRIWSIRFRASPDLRARFLSEVARRCPPVPSSDASPQGRPTFRGGGSEEGQERSSYPRCEKR